MALAILGILDARLFALADMAIGTGDGFGPVHMGLAAFQ
jgi:hypothetical protein